MDRSQNWPNVRGMWLRWRALYQGQLDDLKIETKMEVPPVSTIGHRVFLEREADGSVVP